MIRLLHRWPGLAALLLVLLLALSGAALAAALAQLAPEPYANGTVRAVLESEAGFR